MLFDYCKLYHVNILKYKIINIIGCHLILKQLYIKYQYTRVISWHYRVGCKAMNKITMFFSRDEIINVKK